MLLWITCWRMSNLKDRKMFSSVCFMHSETYSRRSFSYFVDWIFVVSICGWENITSASLLPTIFYFVYLLIIRPVCLCYHPLTCDTESMITMMNCSLQIWRCSCGIKKKKSTQKKLLIKIKNRKKKNLPSKKKKKIQTLFFYCYVHF